MTDPPLRLHAPEALLAVVPYICGYHPQEGNLVVVGFHGMRARFAAIAELPRHADGRSSQLAEQLAGNLLANGADHAAIIGYGPATRVDPVAALLPETFARLGIATVDCIRATEQRWWSYLCTNPACCPPEGSVYDPRSHPAAARLAAAGMVAYPHREAVAAQVRPVTDSGRRAAIRAATDLAHARLAAELGQRRQQETEQWWRQAGSQALSQAMSAQRHNQTLSDEQAAWLTLLVSNLTVRDLAAEQIDGGDAHVRLWADLTRRAEPELAAAPATLCAFAAWHAGDGTLARIAAQRALEAEPTYFLAELLLRALNNAIPPWSLQDRRQVEEDPPHPAA